MADPLSVIASAIAVLSTGVTCANGLLGVIEDIRNAPNELIAHSNEVNNLNSIMDDAQKVCKSLATEGSSTTQFIDTFERLLKEG
jgi:hypothetical protein